VAQVLAVFGVSAVVSGAAQVIVALRRRVQFGIQLPMVLAGGVSVVLGFVFLMSAASAHPVVGMVVIYAASGGADFVIQSWLLRRRMRHQMSPARPTCWEWREHPAHSIDPNQKDRARPEQSGRHPRA
jgi:hypothetical protein